jgi:hypothetical protein
MHTDTVHIMILLTFFLLLRSSFIRQVYLNFALPYDQQHGGNIAMLAERFLHEVAFKLWKAPKYGA